MFDTDEDTRTNDTLADTPSWWTEPVVNEVLVEEWLEVRGGQTYVLELDTWE